MAAPSPNASSCRAPMLTIWDVDQALMAKTARSWARGVVDIWGRDVADLTAVEAARDKTPRRLGIEIDIALSTSAGIAGVNRTVWHTDYDEWRKVVRINPTACLILLQGHRKSP